MVNEFNSNNTQDRHIIAMTNGCKCPKVPDLKLPCRKPDHNDEGEWDMICCEIGQGQKVYIKYKRSYFEFNPAGYNEPCENLEPEATQSEEKLNVSVLGFMEEMHKIIASNTSKT